MQNDRENQFTLAYYDSILKLAIREGYRFSTMEKFWDDGCPNTGRFILRHDLDTNSPTLKRILDVERANGVVSTVYVRVTTNTYNPFDYRTYPVISSAQADGFEIGLHSNFVEFAKFHNLEPERVLMSELQCMRAFFGDIRSIACHRDLNYAYNSLPWLQENWQTVCDSMNLKYEAYDSMIMENILYVNETAEQKLGWRKLIPESAIATGKSICLSTHPHWWYENNPFEV
jgi:hypothetical protein